MLAAFTPQEQTDSPLGLLPGEKRRIFAGITDIVRAQLINNRCWTDHSHMTDALRLQATFRIYIGRDGHFEKQPQLIASLTSSKNDPQLQAFITDAKTALDMCDGIGWVMPKEYFDLGPPTPWIDVTFVPRVG